MLDYKKLVQNISGGHLTLFSYTDREQTLAEVSVSQPLIQGPSTFLIFALLKDFKGWLLFERIPKHKAKHCELVSALSLDVDSGGGGGKPSAQLTKQVADLTAEVEDLKKSLADAGTGGDSNAGDDGKQGKLGT